MSPKRKTLPAMMDSLVSWTGMSGQVKRDMSSVPDDARERRYRPMRWLPFLLMACGAGLVAGAIQMRLPTALFGVVGAFGGFAAALNANGPLGKPALDDDEREAVLRKDALLFSLSVLAFANIVGQPMLMLAAVLHSWATGKVAGVVFAVFICNLAWFSGLRTLYASWKVSDMQDD